MPREMDEDDIPPGSLALCKHCGKTIRRVFDNLNNMRRWVHTLPVMFGHSPEMEQQVEDDNASDRTSGKTESERS